MFTPRWNSAALGSGNDVALNSSSKSLPEESEQNTFTGVNYRMKTVPIAIGKAPKKNYHRRNTYLKSISLQ
ncbi:MAG: hypothetical protein AB8B56_00815 [Crocinitomicaceae bacterium]